MPKSIIDIEVQDQAFKRFYELYGKYQEALKKAPASWAETGKAVSGVGDEMGLMTAALLAQTELIHEQNKEVKALEKTQTEAAKRFKATEKERQDKEKASQDRTIRNLKTSYDLTKKTGSFVVSTLVSAAKYAALGLGAGLLGGGGLLFGLDNLAASVSGQRFTAQGLGITTGQNQAFNLNFGRFVGDGTSFLQNIQNVKSSYATRYQFAQALGLDGNAVNTMDNATLGIDMIKRAQSLWKQAGPNNRTQEFLNSHGFSGILDVPTWTRINAPGNNVAAAVSGYNTDTKLLTVPDKTQNAWQNFSIQLATAGAQIQAVFQTGLIGLAGPLGKLSQSISTALAGLLGSPQLGNDIDTFGDGITKLAKYLGSPEFLADMKTFAADISGIVSYIGNSWVLQKMLGITAPDASDLSTMPLIGPLFRQGNGKGINMTDDVLYHGFDPFPIKGVERGYDFRKIAKYYGLPPELFTAIGMQESGLTAHPNDSVVNGLHYQGIFQQGAAYQKQYGVTNPYDPGQEANALGQGFTALLKRYHNNLAEALASYSGDAELDQQIKSFGAKWGMHANKATQSYVSQVAGRMGIKIDLSNGTGANVAMIANAVPQ